MECVSSDACACVGGVEWVKGFFDEGSFIETLDNWAMTVVCGRARLGGIPCGVIAVETRSVECTIPADPANPSSESTVCFHYVTMLLCLCVYITMLLCHYITVCVHVGSHYVTMSLYNSVCRC